MSIFWTSKFIQNKNNNRVGTYFLNVWNYFRLSDSIKSFKTETKVQALTLLGHVLRKQPTWIYKITEHHLLKDILRLLKVMF